MKPVSGGFETRLEFIKFGLSSLKINFTVITLVFVFYSFMEPTVLNFKFLLIQHTVLYTLRITIIWSFLEKELYANYCTVLYNTVLYCTVQ